MLYLSYLLCCLLSTAFAGSEDEFVGIRVTYEGPKILNTTSVFSQKAMQTFDSLASNANLSFDQIIPFDSPLTVSYSGVNVTSRDQFGGDNSKYCYVEPFSSLKIKFSQPINYFGYWLTALDSNNDLHIFSNNERIFTFTPSDVEAALEGQNNYKKHPQLSLSSYSQFFVFVNFFCENCLFDQVQLYQSGSYGKYETDNHTFGYYTQSSGIVLKTSTTTAPPTQIPTTEETTTPVPTTEETTTPVPTTEETTTPVPTTEDTTTPVPTTEDTTTPVPTTEDTTTPVPTTEETTTPAPPTSVSPPTTTVTTLGVVDPVNPIGDENDEPKKSMSNGVLIGSAFGGVGALAAAGSLYWFMKKGADVVSADTESPTIDNSRSTDEEQTESMTEELWV